METLNIDVLEDITGWGYDFKRISDSIKTFKGDKIVLPINSYGGSVLEGFAIYNSLLAHPAKVETQIVGYAISMGTIVALAADEVKMPENGMFMIHEPWNQTAGDADDMRQGAEILENLANQLAGIYAKKTGIKRAEIRQMMKDETWLNAKQAKKLGFVDTITKGANIQAKLDATQFKNLPKSLIEGPKESQENKPVISGQNNIKKEDTMIDQIVAWFSSDKKAEDLTQDDMTTALVNKLTPAIEASVTSSIKNEMSTYSASIKANENSITEVKASISGLATKEDVQAKIDAALGSVAELKTEIDTLQNSKTDLEKTVAELSGREIPAASTAASGGLDDGLKKDIQGVGLDMFSTGRTSEA